MSRSRLTAIAAALVVAGVVLAGVLSGDRGDSNGSAAELDVTSTPNPTPSTATRRASRRMPTWVTMPMRRMEGAGRARGSLTLMAVPGGKVGLASNVSVPDHRFGLVLTRAKRPPKVLFGSHPGRYKDRYDMRMRRFLEYERVEVHRTFRAPATGLVTSSPVLRIRTESLLHGLIAARPRRGRSVSVPMRPLPAATKGVRARLTLSAKGRRLWLTSRVAVPRHRFGLAISGGGQPRLLLAGAHRGTSEQRVSAGARRLLRYRWIEVGEVVRFRRGPRRGTRVTVPVLRTSTRHLLSRLIARR